MRRGKRRRRDYRMNGMFKTIILFIQFILSKPDRLLPSCPRRLRRYSVFGPPFVLSFLFTLKSP